ncbi:DUF2470 domain-containing protein [Salinibacterium sp. SYSU T00001]|uniref:DUF2470 domain-containing protein n=1 Tax=Homoserinimonas sedimenticola TaxID=2986805 RepID=UPI002235A1EA|nr:DUF2470 domain-containing protein [Salinibacterium sedimenticola]MCW4385749.1 DUF2470 domain-containing protein [Salinibacterium sedimenticola]
MPVFSPEVVAAVLHHMNDDHRDDNLLIARAFGDRNADAATMVDLDEHGGRWTYTAAGEKRELSVPWSTTIDERPEIRREIVVLYDRACAELGVEPRPH